MGRLKKKMCIYIYLWKSPTMWSQFGAAAVVIPVANSRGKNGLIKNTYIFSRLITSEIK